MEEVLLKLKNVINNNQENCEYIGIILYLLTTEDEPYKIYRLNLNNHDRFLEILKDNIDRISHESIIYHYPDCTRPDCSEEISYLECEEIPMYKELSNNLFDEDNIGILKKNMMENIINKSKGYVIRLIYEEEGEQKSILSYFKMTQSAFLKKEKLVFCFDRENGELLSEVEGVQLKFDDRLISVNIDGIMFILSGYSFETLLKYEEHIKKASELALNDIECKGIIENFDVLKNYCIDSKPMKNKLYKIYSQGNINRIGLDDFIRVKECCGEHIMIDINVKDNTIGVKESNIRKSVEHILRVYNDESAETIISGTKIFADKKVPI